MRSSSLALVCVLLSAGCGVLPGPDSPELRVELQQALIARDPETGAATIAFSVRNRGESTVYLNRCGERLTTLLDRWEGGRWVEFRSDICPAVYDMSPYPLDAQEERVGERAVHDPGRYRLRFGTSERPLARSLWIFASPAFTVE